MAHFLVTILVLGMANEMVHGTVEPNLASVTPSIDAPRIRKLASHEPTLGAPCVSPSEAPRGMHYKENVSSLDQEGSVAGEEVHILEKHHHSVDKSIAGGGVIIGGLATTFLVAVVCYIRATGRKHSEPSGSSVV